MKEVLPAQITWLDSSTHGGWHHAHEAENAQPQECVTIGFILEDTDDRVVVAQSICEAIGHIGNILVIPGSLITNIVHLKEVS